MKFLGLFEKYAPDLEAPAAGEFVMAPAPPETGYDQIAVGWRQNHKELVADALRSWKGSPNAMRIHIRDEMEGAPMSTAGSGKKMRMQAAALLHELETNSKRTPKLYRGATTLTTGYLPWSESFQVAKQFAKKGRAAKLGGNVYMLPAGQKGLRVVDYLSTTHDYEREWIVKYQPNQPVLVKW